MNYTQQEFRAEMQQCHRVGGCPRCTKGVKLTEKWICSVSKNINKARWPECRWVVGGFELIDE